MPPPGAGPTRQREGFPPLDLPQAHSPTPVIADRHALWALNAIVFASAYGMLGFGLFFWRDAIVASLAREFGPHAPLVWPTWIVLALATVLQILAYEFAYWSAH